MGRPTEGWTHEIESHSVSSPAQGERGDLIFQIHPLDLVGR